MSRYVQSKVQSKQTAVPVWAGAKGKITSSVVLAKQCWAFNKIANRPSSEVLFLHIFLLHYYFTYCT